MEDISSLRQIRLFTIKVILSMARSTSDAPDKCKLNSLSLILKLRRRLVTGIGLLDAMTSEMNTQNKSKFNLVKSSLNSDRIASLLMSLLTQEIIPFHLSSFFQHGLQEVATGRKSRIPESQK